MKKPKFKKPDFKKLREKFENISLKKPDFKKLKEKFEKISIRKPRLERLKEKFEKFRIETAEASVRQKYKTKGLMAKTKELIKEYDALEGNYIPSEDLNGIQSDISKMRAEIKEKENEDLQWESIKIIPSEEEYVEEDVFRNFREYWNSEFISVLNLYLKFHDLSEALNFFKSPASLKYPILTRLYKKIQSSEIKDYNIVVRL